MKSTVEYKLVNYEDFTKEIEALHPILKGHYRVIAEDGNLNYYQLMNAVQGKIKSPVILTKIYQAVKIYANKLLKEYAA